MENSTLLENETVTDIIHGGVQSYLNQNKNIGVKDLLTKKSRQNAGNQLRDTLKSTALDTGKKVITHLQNNEYQWEDQAQFDKLVTAVRGSSSASKLQQAKCLKIAGKIRGMSKCEEVSHVFKEGIGTMTDADIERTGATPEMQAKVKAKRDAKLKNQKPTTQKSSGETKQLPGQKAISGSGNNKSLKSGKDKKDTSSSSNKGGAIVKSKGSDLANRGNKNTEVKDKRDPKTYRNKKGEGVKVPWKKVRSAARKGAEAAGRFAKSAVGAATAGYGQSSFSEEVSRRKKPSAIRKQKKLEKALATLKLKKKKLNERFGQWKQAVKNRDKAHRKSIGKTKPPKQGSIKSRVKKGVGRVPLKDVNTPAKKQSIQRVGGSRGVHTANRKSKSAQGKQAPVVYSYVKKIKESASIRKVRGKRNNTLMATGDHRRDKEGNIKSDFYKKKAAPTGNKWKKTDYKSKPKRDLVARRARMKAKREKREAKAAARAAEGK